MFGVKSTALHFYRCLLVPDKAMPAQVPDDLLKMAPASQPSRLIERKLHLTAEPLFSLSIGGQTCDE